MATIFQYTKLFVEINFNENLFLDWNFWLQYWDILHRIYLIKDLKEVYPSFFLKKTNFLNYEYTIFNFELFNINYYSELLESGFYSSIFYFLMTNYSYQIIPTIKIDNFYYISNIALIIFKYSIYFLIFLLFTLVNSIHLRYLDVKKNAGTVLTYLHAAGSISAEEEVGSYDDGLLFMCIFMFLIGWWCFFSFLSWIIYDRSWNWMLYGIIFILLTPYTFIIFILYFWGLFICTYIRGTLPNWWGFVTLTKDCINLVLMTGRFTTQNVRFLIILDSMYDIYAYKEDFMDCEFAGVALFSWTWEHSFFNSAIFTEEDMDDVLISGSLLAYNFIDEALHLSDMTVTQAILYLVLCYWLFSLVYCGQFKNRQEKYFLVKTSGEISMCYWINFLKK